MVCYRVWYTVAMVSTSSAVRSIRLQNSEWEWLTQEAARRETTVNGLVADLLMVGRLKAEEARAAPERRPAPKAVSEKASTTAAPSGVQFGPTPRKPGDLAKKPKGK